MTPLDKAEVTEQMLKAGFAAVPNRLLNIDATELANIYVAMEAARLPKDNEDIWQPIETAPKDRHILLAVGRGVGSGCWRTARPFDVTGRNFYVDGGDMPSGATHWRELPKAPRAAIQAISGDKVG